MPYKIIKNLIHNEIQGKKELLNMADIFYAAHRISKDQSGKITTLIK